MTEEDLDGILEVEKTSFPIPWSKNSFEDELKNILATYLVAKVDNTVIGYIGAWFVIDECHITNIADIRITENKG
jgi:ribosomal-protein-alanine N-acetyltransferase